MSHGLPTRSEQPGSAAEAVTAAAGSRRAATMAVRPVTSIRTLEADGIRVFYREAGPPDGAVVLLLHGLRKVPNTL